MPLELVNDVALKDGLGTNPATLDCDTDVCDRTKYYFTHVENFHLFITTK